MGYDETNKKLLLKVGADSVIPFNSGVEMKSEILTLSPNVFMTIQTPSKARFIVFFNKTLTVSDKYIALYTDGTYTNGASINMSNTLYIQNVTDNSFDIKQMRGGSNMNEYQYLVLY